MNGMEMTGKPETAGNTAAAVCWCADKYSKIVGHQEPYKMSGGRAIAHHSPS
jgi:hypothetical protein